MLSKKPGAAVWLTVAAWLPVPPDVQNPLHFLTECRLGRQRSLIRYGASVYNARSICGSLRSHFNARCGVDTLVTAPPGAAKGSVYCIEGAGGIAEEESAGP
jgi:hypothetical protein